MYSIKNKVLRLGLSAVRRSGSARLLAPHLQGLGAIFMLHHVRPEQRRGFAPNRLLEITPEFLDTTCREVTRAGFDIISLDEAHARLTGRQRSHQPFACFTFDDGYRDNRDHALPILKRHAAPFTVYVASDFADGKGFLWWLVLEETIRAAHKLTVPVDGRGEEIACGSDAQKARAWRRLYWRMRAMPEPEARTIVAALAAQVGIDPLAPGRALAMNWAEVSEFACDPLVTIGAHSVSHHALGHLDAATARAEIAGSVKRVERELGRSCRHFCYPYGNPASAGEREFQIARELGLATAVTTAKGFVYARHATATTRLPRVSLNGEFQSVSCLRALLSGVPFALISALRPLLPVQTGPRNVAMRVPGSASETAVRRTV